VTLTRLGWCLEVNARNRAYFDASETGLANLSLRSITRASLEEKTIRSQTFRFELVDKKYPRIRSR
jgi:hypothetical protein